MELRVETANRGTIILKDSIRGKKSLVVFLRHYG